MKGNIISIQTDRMKMKNGLLIFADGISAIDAEELHHKGQGDSWKMDIGIEDITVIVIPDSVTSIGKCAFADCKSLTSINIPDSVTSVGMVAFVGCESLTNITIPDSVTNVGMGAFAGCKSLTNVTIPDSVASIGECAFHGCESLTIKCSKGSYAEEYAKRYGIPVKHIKDMTKAIERE